MQPALMHQPEYHGNSNTLGVPNREELNVEDERLQHHWSKSPGWMLLTQKESWRVLNFTFRLPWGYLLLVASNTKPFGQRPQGMQGRGKMVQFCQQIENHWFGMGEPPKFKTQRDSGLSITLIIKMLVKDSWRQLRLNSPRGEKFSQSSRFL